MTRRAAAFPADFDQLGEAIQLAEKAIEFRGGIDCLVNIVGITFDRPFVKITSEQFDTVYEVNLRAPFFLTHRVVQEFLKSGRAVVCNLSSIHALQGAPGHSVYAGTKGAISAYTR